MSAAPRPLDWARIRLVVFDLDGTLYDQRRLRARILPRLAAAALCDPKLLRMITALRRAREAMAEAEREGFVVELIARAAREARVPEARAREVALHWLETRPLPYLASCAVPGAAELLAALRATGRVTAVLSDYPVAAKVAALGLAADLALSAHDPEINVQKPHPRGLEVAAARAGAAACEVLMIGDRAERDGAAAARFGAAFLRRGRGGDFCRFDEAPFAPVLAAAAGEDCRP
jgi:FMN phosphatase YigB (HAD superfamily)